MGHFPAGTSANLAAHFSQFILKGIIYAMTTTTTRERGVGEIIFGVFNPFLRLFTDTFGQYDYGRDMNLRIYNSTEPPTYNLNSIRVPITLIYGENDVLANPIVSFDIIVFLQESFAKFRLLLNVLNFFCPHRT